MSVIFNLNYYDGSLNDKSTSCIVPKIFGRPEIVHDTVLNRLVLHTPLGSCVTYPVNGSFYEKIISQLSIEMHVCILEQQNEFPEKLLLSSLNNGGIAIGELIEETENEKIFFKLHDGGSYLNFGYEENYFEEKLNTNRWIHIVATYDGLIASLFINGKKIACGGEKNYGFFCNEIFYPAIPNQYISISGVAIQEEAIVENDINMKTDYIKIYDNVLEEKTIEFLYRDSLGGVL